jgi:hypothetical protein
LALITIYYVKDNFPLWASYCLDDAGSPSEAVLQKEIDLSIVKFSEFVEVTDEGMTEPLRLHLLNIIMKRAWARKYGDTEFKEKPQILKDYEDTIKTLQSYKEGVSMEPAKAGSSLSVSITAKERRFGSWFNDPYEE